MILFECNFCMYSTHDKRNYNRHCKSESHKINIKKSMTNICKYCGISYSTKSNLARHTKNCNQKYLEFKVSLLH